MNPSDTRPDRGRQLHITTLLERLRLARLLARWPAGLVWAVYMFVNGFITIGLLALLAAVTHNPFVFPSLGPTAYLVFFSPLAPASTPRNTIFGHAVAIVCGYGAFALAGLNAPGGLPAHLMWPRVLAAALSLSATGAVMVLAGINHPPAGATTLIVALGIIAEPRYLLIIEAAVILLTAQAFAINRLAGLPYPLWRTKEIQHD
ncbi:MAG TPA: HPP family protein [Bryobacteraceae bacterium]|nr:HPP family protein [Bryobacteraceae bacterium]